jgi:hypothetical protein
MKKSIIILLILIFLVLLTTNAWAERVEKVIEESFLLQKTGSFSLNNVAGNIMVYSWDKEEVKMVATKSISSWGTSNPEELLDSIEIEIVSQPKTLKINTYYPQFSWVRNARVDYQLWIPETCAVELESISGAIQMDNRLNRIYTKTVSGSIKLSNIMGNAEIKTVSGNVSATKINGEIRAGSVSGSLIFRDCEGSLPDLHSTSGSIEAELAVIDQDTSAMSLSTVSGNINLYLPDDASFDLDINTVSGEINTEFKVLVESVKKNQLRGEVGDGGINIELRTISGDISLGKL